MPAEAHKEHQPCLEEHPGEEQLVDGEAAGRGEKAEEVQQEDEQVDLQEAVRQESERKTKRMTRQGRPGEPRSRRRRQNARRHEGELRPK